MINRIYPTWQQIDTLKSSPTHGEITLLKYLDKFLPLDWEIFFKPQLNGDKPDIAILNEKVGLMIFEVKDWNLKHYRSEKEFFSQKNSKSEIIKIPYRAYYVKKDNKFHKVLSPIKQVERYIKNLTGLYEPQIGESIDLNKKNISAFKTGIYFHNATTESAKKFISADPVKCTIFGNDYLSSGKEKIESIVPDVNRKNSISMKVSTINPSNSWGNKIRFWLMPPFHTLEQGTKIKLTNAQLKNVLPSPNQHQRLRGAAGSGKTLVIAQRAANMAQEGKKVLIITFNITLWHYIRDHIQRARYGFNWDKIEFNHFHGFCKNYLNENDEAWPKKSEEVSDTDFLREVVPKTVIEIKKSGKNKKIRLYDVILIDEGQDYHPLWYDMLCLFLSKNNELLLVIDEKQNIYGNKNDWIDSMQGTQFRGRWRVLNESIRLPENILEQVNKFSEMFLPNLNEFNPISPENPIQTSFLDPKLIWRNITSFNDGANKILEAYKWLTKTKNMHPQDIIILVPTHLEGFKLIDIFKKKLNVKINHVFEEDKESRNKKNKMSFWMGDSRLKMSTIHSFKGWELINVIILTPPNNTESSQIDELIYTSLTRSRTNLIVFNRLKKYEEYGNGWTIQE